MKNVVATLRGRAAQITEITGPASGEAGPGGTLGSYEMALGDGKTG